MLRVLSIPGRTHDNRFFGLLADALEQEDVIIVAPSLRNTITFAFDVLHLNFPTHYIEDYKIFKASILSFLLGSYLIIAKLLGRRLIYTVHDVTPFRITHRLLLKAFLRLTHWVTDAFIFLSNSSRAEFVRVYPQDAGKKWITTLHGPYPVTMLTTSERDQRRRDLAIGSTDVTVGFLGNIKPYKNIAALSQLPTHLADGRAVRAVVAGRIESGHEGAVEALLDSRPSGSVIRVDGRLTDARLDELIQIVDFVLLPYTKGSNSGVAMLVLSNHGRVIGSDLSIFRELAASVRPPWAYSFSTGNTSASNLQTTLEHAAAQPVLPKDVNELAAFLERTSFASAAKAIKTLCDSIR